MKKFVFATVMALFAIQLVAARDVVTKDEHRLPEKARSFIQQNFPDVGISYIKIDNEFFKGKKYEVVLTSGAEIEFNSKGDWAEVNNLSSG